MRRRIILAASSAAAMIVTSPSELTLRDDCGLAHDFKYRRRLRLIDEKRSPTLASGTAVHRVVETICGIGAGEAPTTQLLTALAEEYLGKEFTQDDDGGGQNVKKFLPGVVRALTRVPEWIWLAEWYVETEIVGHFTLESSVSVQLRGRPDMFRLVNDEAPSVEVVDIKTTDADPLEFVLWTPQIRMYAACLQQAFPDRLITYRYVCVPTAAGNKAAPASALFVLTRKAYDNTVAEILAYAEKLKGPAMPRYARRCQWCDYAPICTAVITGADAAGITAELYAVKGWKAE